MGKNEAKCQLLRMEGQRESMRSFPSGSVGELIAYQTAMSAVFLFMEQSGLRGAAVAVGK